MRLLYNEMVIKMASGIGIQTTRWSSNLINTINTLFNLHGTSEKSQSTIGINDYKDKGTVKAEGEGKEANES